MEHSMEHSIEDLIEHMSIRVYRAVRGRAAGADGGYDRSGPERQAREGRVHRVCAAHACDGPAQIEDRRAEAKKIRYRQLWPI